MKDSYRGRGIGTQLMDVAEKASRARGVRRMELEVFAKNTKAIELYKRLGYVQEGLKKGAVEDNDGFDDIVVMAKQVSKTN